MAKRKDINFIPPLQTPQHAPYFFPEHLGERGEQGKKWNENTLVDNPLRESTCVERDVIRT